MATIRCNAVGDGNYVLFVIGVVSFSNDISFYELKQSEREVSDRTWTAKSAIKMNFIIPKIMIIIQDFISLK